MSDRNVSSDETRPEHHTDDLERGSDETIKHSAYEVSTDVDVAQHSRSTVMYESMYQSLMVTPWGIDKLLTLVLPKPKT